MCGFAGIFGQNERNREDVVKKMGDRIAHRGPDGEGFFSDENVALAFRRLSIIDLCGGAQPMLSFDGRFVLVFNGEIYNYKELKQMLIQRHHCVFKTESDTEVLLQTYIVYRERTASMLRGMFAFVVYDSVKKSIYGARDPFGIKPFYYTLQQGDFLFASEIKAFLAYPHFQKEVNPDALKMYLIFQYNPLKETMFRGVYKLEPGHYFTYDGQAPVTECYFNPTYKICRQHMETSALQIEAKARDSVSHHLLSDVEVGCFLSGGVDSGYIAALAKPEKSFSVGFETEGFDETDLSKELSRQRNIKNTCKKISSEEFFDAVPKVQYYSDEPHANLSAVPLYCLSEMASKQVRVVLSGEGADELFGGYETYRPSISGKLYQMAVPSVFRKKLGSWAKKKPPKRGLNFLKRNAFNMEEGYIGQAFIMDNEEADALLAGKYTSRLCCQDVTGPIFNQVSHLDELHKKMYLDMHLWLPNDILLKADKMTMAHSLELRVPYLDKGIWSCARTLDQRLLADKKATKKALRKAAGHLLPANWATRGKKGFPVPICQWLREEKYVQLLRDMFMKDFAGIFFDRKMLLGWLEQHQKGEFNHQRKLYTVFAFLVWYEQYFVLR